MGYQPGDYFHTWLQQQYTERNREKAFERQLQMYFMERDEAKLAEKRRQEWNDHRDSVMMFSQAYSQANTPMEKESIRQRWLSFSERIPESMRAGTEELLKTSPLSQQKMLDAEWFKNNPTPPTPNFSPEENPYKYATMLYDQEMHKAQFAQDRRKQAYTIPSEIPIDKETFAYRDSQGKVHLEKYEVKNKFYEAKAEGTGMSGYELMRRGGWVRPTQSTVWQTDQETGEQKQVLVNIEQNTITGETRVNPIYTGETKKSTSAPRDTMKIRPDTNSEVRNMLGFLHGRVDPGPMRPELNEVYDRIDQLGEDYYEYSKKVKTEEKDSVFRQYELHIEKELQTLDGRFSYILVNPSDEDIFVERSPGFLHWQQWNKRLKLGKDTLIKPVPGRRAALMSKDGTPIEVIIDDPRNAVYNAVDGSLIGTMMDAQQLIGSKTRSELERGIK